MTAIPHLARAVGRLALAGLVTALLVGAIGLAFERARFGSNDEAAVSRAQGELRQRFAETADRLASRAERIAASADSIRAAGRDDLAARALFVALDEQLPARSIGAAGISIYDAAGSPLAWSGRVSDIPRERLTAAPETLFVALGALGPRLVHVRAVRDPERPAAPRLATVVAEELVDPTAGISPIVADTFTLPTSVVDVALRVRAGPVATRSPYAFPIQAADGQVLAEAEVSPRGLAAARDAFRVRTRAAVLTVLALTVLACAGPLLERRRHTRDRRTMVLSTAAVVVFVLAARGALRLALSPLFPASLASPLTLVSDALLLALLVWLTLDIIGRRRVSWPRMPLLPFNRGTVVRIWAAYFVGGALAAALLWGYERVLQSIATQATVDLLQFSLHPLDFARLGLVAGLLLLHAAVVWAGALLIRLPSAVWRTPRRTALRAVAAAACVAGMAAVVLVVGRASIAVPIGSLATALAVTGLAAAALSRPRGPSRRASQAGRLGVLFLALVVPAAAFYPSLHALSAAAKERQVSGEFAAQAASQREDLQVRRLPHALEAIDAMSDLPLLVTGSAEDAAPTTDRAYIVWSKTELARYRTTSAVELYGPDGRLVSRFALNLPEYTTTTYPPGSCDDWELYEEPSPFGSSLRYVLRASRGIRAQGRRVGGVVVRAMLDYRSLPFIASQSPYLESLRPERSVSEDESGLAVEFVFYGWSRAPLYASGTSVWSLDDSVFDRMVESRSPFWTNVQRGAERFRVYVFNDRGGIYALGYPLIGWVGHLIKLGELVFLSAVLYTLLLAGVTLFNTVTSQTPASGRALLREIRSSFYRKLFIAFVASAVVPVVVLAIATRTYFANQFRTRVEETAVKTATVAQRLIEDYASLQQRGSNALNVIDDRFMVLVRRAIDQDVNLFARSRLQATSERELFANAILPSRTPGSVYRKIMLDRLPASIDVEEVGGLSYLLAAAPVRAGGLEGIVTVPQTLQRQQIEEQRDELDRRVLSASVLFVLLGSALGYWMAERIADPVNRLTRATRRIARGDLDARIAATSSDELRRLVEDFNRMADDLKRQRRELERTQRLEAWADMARQVAHDIKNPLTPIQLSAEHARRINIDRGRPLSPVLDECVAAILTQVKLLRQISTEFSSFASSPTPRPEPSDLPALVDQVVEPYRAGLTGRVAIETVPAPDVPPVMVDRTLFARALTNVIENALHAMPGGGRLSLKTRLSQPAGTTVDVEVTDSGVGMDQEALGRIFEPYFSTKASGTGLGLTIAKRNIELNGGTIAVTSQRGIGTTVMLTVPVA